MASNTQYQWVQFRAPFYEGWIQGRVGVNREKQPAQISSGIVLNHVNLNGLKSVLADLARVDGTLESQINFRGYPDYDLNGKVDIQEARFNDFEFIRQFADYFDLPSLQNVIFNRAISKFSVNKTAIRLYDVHLFANNVNVDGYFRLGRNDLVSSKFSLMLTRALMEASSHLKPLLKLVDKKIDPLKFDFQLSGQVDSLNFQWAQSELKKKIQDSLPSFIERIIERKIETAVDSAPVN